jgi:hypothetical protein
LTWPDPRLFVEPEEAPGMVLDLFALSCDQTFSEKLTTEILVDRDTEPTDHMRCC